MYPHAWQSETEEMKIEEGVTYHWPNLSHPGLASASPPIIMKAGPPSYVDFRLINTEIFQRKQPGRIQGSPSIADSRSDRRWQWSDPATDETNQNDVAITIMGILLILSMHLVKQHLWGVGHPSWLSRTMLDETSGRKIMSQIHRQRQSNLSARAGARRAPRRRRARIVKLTSLSAGQGRTEHHLPQALSYLSWRLLFHNSQLFLLHFTSNNKYLWFAFHYCLLSFIQAHHHIWGRF